MAVSTTAEPILREGPKTRLNKYDVRPGLDQARYSVERGGLVRVVKWSDMT